MNTGVQRSSAHAAGRAHRDDDGGRRRSPGNVFGTGQERAADRDGARDPLRRDRHGRRPARPRGQGRAGDEPARRALPAHPGAVPARLGLGPPDTIKLARLARETGIFPVFEAEHGEVTAVTQDPPPRAGRGVPEAAAALRASVRQAPGTRRCWRASRPIADRNIRRFGLLDDRRPERRDHGKPFAITLDPGSSLANKTGSWRTERPVYVDRLPPCNAPARPAKTSRAGCSTPRAATTKPPGAT